MMEILMNYTFQIVALGSVILAVAAAPVGAFSVYKGQSLIGDAIGHSTFPGIILAYHPNPQAIPALLAAQPTLTWDALHIAPRGAHILPNDGTVTAPAPLAAVPS